MAQKYFKLKLLLSWITFFVACLSFAQGTSSNICQGLSQRCQVKKILHSGPSEVEDQYVLDITLGPLAESQFLQFQDMYFAKTPKTYDPQRIYKLADFFPIFMQQLNGKVLLPHSLPADSSLVSALESQNIKIKKSALVDGNCHSVSWQWINFLQGASSQEALLTLVSGDDLGEYFFKNQIPKQQIQPGDVLAVLGNGGINQVDAILHSAIYLGYGLVFEKPNPGENYPYRISELNDVINKYKKIDPKAKFQFYRNQVGQKKLPTLSEELSLISPNAQKAFNLDLSQLNKSMLETYILQEEWNSEKEESLFTLGRILKATEASPKKFKSLFK